MDTVRATCATAARQRAPGAPAFLSGHNHRRTTTPCQVTDPARGRSSCKDELPFRRNLEEFIAMLVLTKLLHLAAAILWLGGMGFVLLVLRSAASATLAPPQRLPLMAAAMRRFFVLVWVCIVVLLTTGIAMLAAAGPRAAPPGWHAMFGIGLVMFALFAYLYFGPFRRLRRAVAAQDWPAGGAQLRQIASLVVANFVLGWLAIAALRGLS
jgi:uncharacterized membrane protein